MTSDAPEWFGDALVALAEAYPSFRLREGTVRIYWAVVRGLPPDAVLGAIGRAPAEHPNFFPTAGQLRALIVPPVDDAGLLAWVGLHRAASSVGAYGDLDCADPAVAQALLSVFGSWPAFCEQCSDIASAAWNSKKQEFLAAYREARRTGDAATARARVAGLLGDASPSRTWVATLTEAGGVHVHKADALAKRE